MALQKKIKNREKRRVQRVRSGIKRHSSLPRVTVFRSLNNIYAQVIDDTQHTTVASYSSRVAEGVKGDKTAVAHAVGVELAKRTKEKGVEAVVFDRGSFLYHGRVKALADGLREGGLKV